MATIIELDTKLPNESSSSQRPELVSAVVVVQRRSKASVAILMLLGLFLFMLYQYPVFVQNFLTVETLCKSTLVPPSTRGMYLENRSKLLAQLKALNAYAPGELVFMLGNQQKERTYSDTDILFRQDSNFLYVSGYNIPDCALALDVDTGYSIMFLRRKSRSEIIFDGGVDNFEDVKEQTDVDSVYYDDEIADALERFQISKVHTVSSSDLTERYPELRGYTIDDTRLLSSLFSVRQVKTETELALSRISSDVTSRAHESIMQAVVPGMTESDLESLFLYECYNCGLRFQSYIGIFGAGKNGAVLHYIRNDATIKDGDIILVDAAGEFKGYTSDVTRTFPANGRFTADQRAIYQTVLNAQKAAIDATAPGVSWTSVNNIANRLLVEGLLEAGILQGGTVDELLNARVLSTFYPHGLGHPVGLDVHDPTPSPWIFAYNQLFTIEPGIYFIDMLIEEAKQSSAAKYYNFDVIERFQTFGGVRIEDVIRITSTGHEILTNVPKEIDEVEELMNRGRYF